MRTCPHTCAPPFIFLESQKNIFNIRGGGGGAPHDAHLTQWERREATLVVTRDAPSPSLADKKNFLSVRYRCIPSFHHACAHVACAIATANREIL
jgi:hypothetical protein